MIWTAYYRNVQTRVWMSGIVNAPNAREARRRARDGSKHGPWRFRFLLQ